MSRSNPYAHDTGYDPSHSRSLRNSQDFSSYSRGQNYTVSSGTSYIPPREDTVSPPSPSSHYTHHPLPPPPSTGSRYTMPSADRSPSPPFEDMMPLPPPPPAQTLRDPHANQYPIPPPQQYHRSSSPDARPQTQDGHSSRRPIAAAGAFGAGLGGTAAAASAYHSRNQSSVSNPYSDAPSDPFRDSQQSLSRSFQDQPSSQFHRPSMSQSRTSSATKYPAAAVAPLAASSSTLDLRPGTARFPSGYDTAYPGNGRSSTMGEIDPMDIEDEGDDFNLPPQGSRTRGAAAGAAAGGAAAGGFLSMFKGKKSRDVSGNYGSVPGGASAAGFGAAGEAEKSSWLKQQTSGNKRLKWMVGGLIGLVIILAIIGGTVGAVLSNRSSSSSSGDSTPKGDLTKDSPEVKAVMNNKNFHKIFPGVDYTPLNAQYPDCLNNPPNQNNVTLDVAVLSQLSPAIRLYGTDCNQTEMVLEAISRLGMTNQDIKVWAGVWLETNQTTNDRQLSQMYDIFKKYKADPFAGVIVGNEVIFRKDMTVQQLSNTLNQVRTNLTGQGVKLSVSTSDLGATWKDNPSLADASDIVMANDHPFFSGTPIDQAAGWTYSYWQNNDVAVASGKHSYISEVGWPSQGGSYCTDSAGSKVDCPNPQSGSVAGIPQLNQFLSDWACPALNNGTQYFWFEGFDEPWQAQYDKPGAAWEDHWGLLDVNRNLKKGVTVPDCGKEASVPT